MIFHSYLVSNRQFQDVVKNFSDLLYFENEASYEKVLFYTFELFFHVESFSLLSYVPPVTDILRTKQTRTTARNMKNIPSVLLSSFWHMKIPNERRNRDATVSSVFNSFALTMRFCFSTWHFFSPYAIITCKNRLFWKQLWKLLRFVWFIKKFSLQLLIGERFEIRW